MFVCFFNQFSFFCLERKIIVHTVVCWVALVFFIFLVCCCLFAISSQARCRRPTFKSICSHLHNPVSCFAMSRSAWLSPKLSPSSLSATHTTLCPGSCESAPTKAEGARRRPQEFPGAGLGSRRGQEPSCVGCVLLIVCMASSAASKASCLAPCCVPGSGYGSD